MTFYTNKRFFALNGTRVFLGSPGLLQKDKFLLAKQDVEKTLLPLILPQKSPMPPKLYHIVLDPGHGGKDPGAQSQIFGLKEKELNLDIAKRVKRKLEIFGYKVTLTREKDRYLSLRERTAIAERRKADLFISIHFNASSTKTANGVETYCLAPVGQPSSNEVKSQANYQTRYPGNQKDCWNILCAYYVQSTLVRTLGAVDRGVKRARFSVLRTATMPSILVEVGYITNAQEVKKIKTEAYRQKVAQSIANGVFLYQKTLNRIRNNL